MSSRSLVKSDFTVFSSVAEGVAAVGAAGGFVFTPTALDLTNHPGVWGLSTGAASAAGRIFIISRPAAYHVGVGGLTRTATWLRTEATLSTALQRYTLRAGFYSIILPNVILEGIGFEYDDSQNGGRWQAICHDGAETSVDTGVTVAADTWYKLELEVNDDGTSVEFFIDNVSVATIAANIPAGTGFSLFYNAHIMKLIGTAPRLTYVDAYYVYQEISR